MPWHGDNSKRIEKSTPHIALQVISNEKLPQLKLTDDKLFCYVCCKSYEQVFQPSTPNNSCFVYPRTHAQFVVRCIPHEDVPEACIVLTQVQLLNFEVTADSVDKTTFSLYDVSLDKSLNVVDMEIKPRFAEQLPHAVSLECSELRNLVLKHLFQSIVTAHERVLLLHDGIEYLIRFLGLYVTAEDEDGNEDVVDVHRGVVDANTVAYFTPAVSCGAFFILNNQHKDISLVPSNSVEVICNDEEYFYVRKKLLQPCIALTKQVLDKSKERQKVFVDVDCCIFDRVLLFLEDPEGYSFDIELVHDMKRAATELKLFALESKCEEMLGEFNTRIHREGVLWHDVLRRNSEGSVVLVIDAMVFDVTRWLPEHPGGNSIIPEQALNKDSTIFFEIFHSSRQSFKYLKSFYIGDLKPQDVSKVPSASRGLPSEGFIEQLRLSTDDWRVKPVAKVHKSF